MQSEVVLKFTVFYTGLFAKIKIFSFKKQNLKAFKI